MFKTYIVNTFYVIFRQQEANMIIQSSRLGEDIMILYGWDKGLQKHNLHTLYL